METAVLLFLYLTIYSFLGWVCETAYCSIGARKFINRGFLNGPVCPVYGFGALLIITLLTPIAQNTPHVWAVFLGGMILTSVLEYFTGFLLETIFHMKWWDYSKRFCNIHGRVCLGNSILFGLLAVALLYLLHPAISRVVESLSFQTQWILSALLLLGFLTDLVISVRSALKLSGKLETIHQTLADFQEKQKLWAQEMGEKYHEALAANLEKLRLPPLEEAAEALSEKRLELRRSMEELREKFTRLQRPSLSQRRLLNAFPHLHSSRFEDAMEHLRVQLNRLYTVRKAKRAAKKSRRRKNKKNA